MSFKTKASSLQYSIHFRNGIARFYPYITVRPYDGTYIIYYLCIRNQNSLIMETREYFEKIMQDYNQNRTGRSLRCDYVRHF